MNQNQAAAFINAQVMLMQCRLEGMKVANRERELINYAHMAYTEEKFIELEYEFASTLGHDAIQQLYETAHES